MKKKYALLLNTIFLIASLIITINKNNKWSLIVASILFPIELILIIIVKNTNINTEIIKKTNDNVYIQKLLFTHNELMIYKKLKNIVKDKYIVQAQIPLSAVVKKISNTKYANELYRTIDFGIFDEIGKVKVLIELNDKTHLSQERQERDRKVKEILKEAGIPIITLWTNKENSEEYILEKIKEVV